MRSGSLLLAALAVATACQPAADDAVGGDAALGPDAGAAAPDAGPGPDAPPGPVPSCGGAALCDGFETGAGAAPDPSRWTVATPDCSGDGVVAVDPAVAHGGARSLRVTASGGYCNHVFVASTTSLATWTGPIYGRFFVRLDDALGDGHVTFLAMADDGDGADLRMGGQSRILMWNRERDDATLPELSPAGIGLSTAPAPGAWTCVELEIDGAAGTLRTWVDGAEVAGLVVDGAATPDVDRQWLNGGAWRPHLTDLRLGWESYGGQAMTLWFDDVAFGGARIPCDAR
ncbi:MAG: hydrolase [Kofleriaceae bacterium]|nr:hydrolase [Kofleriaceae bacterium]